MISVSSKQKGSILLVFVVLGFLIYSNTFDASFHYDDAHVVSDLSFEGMLEKCKGGGSRFICHLTFALNYWLGGTDVIGYHIFNTLVHIGTSFFVFIFLFQVLSISNPKHNNPEHVNRILPPLTDPVFWPAFLGGILFLVHPLATQSVTYITQRYASLAGFFYIGSLALFVCARIRFQQGERFLKGAHLVPYLCSFVMAVLAMRTKEMTVTLPAVVLLTEYYFIQSDFKAIGKRILYLLPLLSTGLIIPVSDMIGIDTISLESLAALQDYTWDIGVGITRKEYLLTQFKIILGIYLKLLVWPIGQNIDHDYVISKTLFDFPTMTSFLGLCVILAGGLWLFKRSRLVSFGILWFFLTISPTSSIVPNSEFVAEHRAYISLMGLAFAAAGLPARQTHWKRYLSVMLPVLFLLSSLTYARNRVWKTDLTLWEDSVAKSPKKARPHTNLGVALYEQKSLDEAISHYAKALAIWPDFAETHNNLGLALDDQGKPGKALSHYFEALRIKPYFAEAHYNIGNALRELGRYKEAISHYNQAIKVKADFAKAHYNLGVALSEQEQLDEAISHFYQAINIKSDFADAHNNLGSALAQQGLLKEAISHFNKALQINSDFAKAHYNLGLALDHQGKLNEAISHFYQALLIKPDFADAHNSMGSTLMRGGNLQKAMNHYSGALRIRNDFPEAHNNLGIALAHLKKFKEATSHFYQALNLKPDYAEAHYNLGNALYEQDKIDEAVKHYSEAIRINPSYAEAHNNLGGAFLRHGRHNEAIAHFQKALQAKPDYTDARRNLTLALKLIDKDLVTPKTVINP